MNDMDSKSLLRLGLASLVVANVAGYFLRRSGALNESTADVIFGLLMGVAIGLLLFSLYKGRKK